MKDIITILLDIFNQILSSLKNYLLIRKIGSKGKNLKIEYPAKFIGTENIYIGNNFNAKSGLKLRAFKSFNDEYFKPSIILGNNINIENNCHISSINKIIIEDNVLIASNVYISDHAHGLNNYSDLELSPINRKLFSKGPIHIEENVWIGENVVILPGVKIGRCSIIAASSVVTKDVGPYNLVGGVPAKTIKILK